MHILPIPPRAEYLLFRRGYSCSSPAWSRCKGRTVRAFITIIGGVEGPEVCISSRSRPEQSTCCSSGVIAVAHRRPAVVRAVLYRAFITIIGGVEGPEARISSRSRPEQSTCCSSGVIAVAHRHPAVVRAVLYIASITIIGGVEGPDGCISSRSRPEQSTCCSSGVIAVAHRSPAAARAERYEAFKIIGAVEGPEVRASSDPPRAECFHRSYSCNSPASSRRKGRR